MRGDDEMRDWMDGQPVRDRLEGREDVVRGMRVVGLLILLYCILIAVSAVDEHCTRHLDALRQPVPVRTER